MTDDTHEPRPISARRLAEVLAEHPDADVRLMIPSQNAVLGAMFFPNDDGSMSDAPRGVFLLGIDLPGLRAPG